MFFSVEMVNHNKIYPLENIIRAVFYNVKLSFCEEYENKILSEFNNDEVKTTIIFNNKAYLGKSVLDFSSLELSKIENIIKLSFLDAAKKICDYDLPWGILIGISPSKIATRLLEKGISQSKVKEILIGELKIQEEKVNLMLKAAYYENKIKKSLLKNSASLYISVPFCRTRCSYCTFVSKTYQNEEILDLYLDALIYELETLKEINEEINIETIYVGGGTPTSFNEKQIYRLLSHVEKLKLGDIKEYTVEAGRPDTITNEKLKIIKDFKVDRISINPQTLNDRTLKIIGRNHSSKEFFEAFKMAKKIGFDVINTDLICGLKGETLSDFKNTLNQIINLNPENITIHTLSVKRGSQIIDQKQLLKEQNTCKEMLQYASDSLLLYEYIPYYLYRQKSMVDNLENIGYTIANKECIYNIAVMNEIQNIISFGGGGVSKLVDENGKVIRFRNYKDADYYIKNYKEMTLKKTEFFNSNIGRCLNANN